MVCSALKTPNARQKFPTTYMYSAFWARYPSLNLDCEYKTFTNYPDGVRLYSSRTVDTVIWGVMIYMRMRTTYRLAAEGTCPKCVTLALEICNSLPNCAIL